jgi:hypothetical protein
MSKLTRNVLKNVNTNPLPTGIKLTKWVTGEDNLPNKNGYYFVRYKMIDTEKEYHSVAMFVYDVGQRQPDYDKWCILGGGECYARESEDNTFIVTHWTKMEAMY